MGKNLLYRLELSPEGIAGAGHFAEFKNTNFTNSYGKGIDPYHTDMKRIPETGNQEWLDFMKGIVPYKGGERNCAGVNLC